MLACTGNHEIEAESDGKNSIFTSVQARWKVTSITRKHRCHWYQSGIMAGVFTFCIQTHISRSSLSSGLLF